MRADGHPDGRISTSVAGRYRRRARRIPTGDARSRAMGVLMFRFWAGATANLLVGLVSVSGVSAEGIGSTIAPPDRSKASISIVLADEDANFFSRTGPANYWDRSSGVGLAKPDDSATGTTSIAFVDFVSVSPFGAAWTPTDSVINATSPRALRMTDSRSSFDAYFGAFESLSKQGAKGPRSGASFADPIGGSSAVRPMR